MGRQRDDGVPVRRIGSRRRPRGQAIFAVVDSVPIRTARRKRGVRPSFILIAVAIGIWSVVGLLYYYAPKTRPATPSKPPAMAEPTAEQTSPSRVPPTAGRQTLPNVSPKSTEPKPEDPTPAALPGKSGAKSLEGEWEWTRKIAGGEIVQPRAGPRPAIADDDPAKKALESIQGNWKVTYGVASGEEAFADGKVYITQIQGSKITLPSNVPIGLTFKIDPTQNPPAFTIDDKMGSLNGIYELKGDTLRLCFTTIKNLRPVEFKSDKASVTIILEMKRVK